MKDQLLELAARCEAATGADRELDGDIGRVTGAWKTQSSYREYRPTASIDAALTLVPEGCHASVDTELGLAECGILQRRHDDSGVTVVAFVSDCSTAALAICAAALRARAA